MRSDEQVATSRAHGGPPRRDDAVGDSGTTTGTTHNALFVGRVAGDDLGYAEETGAEARAADEPTDARRAGGCDPDGRGSPVPHGVNVATDEERGELMDARKLCDRVREECSDVEDRIRHHPWLAELEAGGLPAAALRAFAGEQLRIIPSDLRSFEMIAQRFGDEPAHGYLEGMAAGERTALQALERFATAAGLDARERQDHEPTPGCQAYPSFVARLARDGTPAEVAGAFLVNLDAWGSCCARMAAALSSTYGFAETDCAFFAQFAGPTTDLERASLEVIDAGLAHGVDPAAVARAARLLQAYELLYWDSLPLTIS